MTHQHIRTSLIVLTGQEDVTATILGRVVPILGQLVNSISNSCDKLLEASIYRDVYEALVRHKPYVTSSGYIKNVNAGGNSVYL